MKNRRGIALLAALWFVVAIATIGLALELEAKEHRTIGLDAADQGAAAAAATGGLSIALARLDQATRQLPRATGSATDRLRASDPWLEPDSLFPGPLRIGNATVHLHAEDVEASLNISQIGVPELRTFLAFVLKDYEAADALAQAIGDWRDRDSLPQPRGAERRDYLARRQLDLPSNGGGFRVVEELRSVRGMTPAIFARIRPYLRTQGGPAINVNTAPAAVLRAIPGITDAVITRILALRSQHRRIASVEDLGGAGAWQEQVESGVSFSTTMLALTVTVVLSPTARPVQYVWTLSKGGDRAVVRWTDAWQ